MRVELLERIKIFWLFLVLVWTVAGCSQTQMGESGDLLTVGQVVKAFQESGIRIVEDDALLGEKVELNGVKPSVFTIDGSKNNRLFVYVFHTIDDRKAVTETWDEEKRSVYQEYSNKDAPNPPKYTAKNILIVNPVEDLEEYFLQDDKLAETVFEKLNQGQTILCKGESENWEGTFTLKYYLHQWTDADGTLRHEGEYRVSRVLQYKLPDIPYPGEISYEYIGPGGHAGRGMIDIEENQRIFTGASGGNGYYPTENLVYSVKVKWDGKEEEFEARPVNNPEQ